MPGDLRIATAQFENRSGDKQFNLTAIEELAAKAARLGANAVAFQECSITGYGFARRLSREQLWDLAEAIPGGASIEALTGIARRHGIAVLVGLFYTVFELWARTTAHNRRFRGCRCRSRVNKS